MIAQELDHAKSVNILHHIEPIYIEGSEICLTEQYTEDYEATKISELFSQRDKAILQKFVIDSSSIEEVMKRTKSNLSINLDAAILLAKGIQSHLHTLLQEFGQKTNKLRTRLPLPKSDTQSTKVVARKKTESTIVPKSATIGSVLNPKGLTLNNVHLLARERPSPKVVNKNPTSGHCVKADLRLGPDVATIFAQEVMIPPEDINENVSKKEVSVVCTAALTSADVIRAIERFISIKVTSLQTKKFLRVQRLLGR